MNSNNDKQVMRIRKKINERKEMKKNRKLGQEWQNKISKKRNKNGMAGNKDVQSKKETEKKGKGGKGDRISKTSTKERTEQNINPEWKQK